MNNADDFFEFFSWNKNFETGILLIDEQHKKLVHLLNQLAAHLAHQSGPIELNKVVSELAAYADYHFKTEEEFWHPYFKEDSWFTTHQSTHNSFMTKVLELKAEESSKPLEEVIGGILTFLTRWLAIHILESDMRMAKTIQAIETGKSLEQAKKKADLEMSGSKEVLIETVLGMYDSLSSRTLDLMKEKAERKRAEYALRESEKREQSFSDAVMNSMPGLIFLYDDQLRLVRWNQKHIELTGYSNAELSNKHLFDFFEEGRHQWVKDEVEEIYNKGQIEIEESLLTKDGSHIPFLFSAVLMRLEGKNFFSGVGIDITDHKQAEEKLIESERMHKEAQELTHLGHWKLSHETGGLFWADEIYRIFELNPEKFEPSYESFLKMIHPDDRDLVEQEFARSLESHLPYEIEHRLLMDDGRVKHVKERGLTDFSRDGSPIQTIGTVHDITKEVVAEQKLEKSLEVSKEALLGTVSAVAKAGEARDPYTAGHQMRVSNIAVAIAEELGLDDTVVEGIRLGARIHDIGKMGVPVELLTKPTRLNELEYKMIQRHALGGLEILEGVQFPWPIAEIVSQHHERLDGTGYPNGLKGDEICLEARIVAVADVFEAMSAHRPYRAALGVESAMKELTSNRGKFYDSDIVDALVQLRQKGKDYFG